jgi:hypothetical protein
MVLTALAVQFSFAFAGDIALKDGVISYASGAAGRAVVQAGGPCADLWVSSDGQTMAFVRMDRSRPGDFGAPFIEQSTVFVAFRSTHFKPQRVDLEPPRIGGRDWNVFRQPVLSPDRRTVYFEVPTAATSWTLMSVSVSGGSASQITRANGYCVLWGGAHSGDLFVAIHEYPVDPTREEIVDAYYRFSGSRRLERVGSWQADGPFEHVVSDWVTRHGGVGSCEKNARW